MSEENKIKAEEQDLENQTSETEEQVSEEVKEKEEAEISPEDLIEKLNEDITSLKDQRLRAIAELENFRKRAEKDQSDALKYGISNTHGIISDKELKTILSIVEKYKINLFDTAVNYGLAEKRLGEFLMKENKIITKVGYFKKGNNLKDQITNSFKNLKRGNIYGCLFHNSNELIENKNLWEDLKKYKLKGKIKKIGYSLYEPSKLLKLLENISRK